MVTSVSEAAILTLEGPEEDQAEEDNEAMTSLVATFPSRSATDLRLRISAREPRAEAASFDPADTSLDASSAPLPLAVVVVDPTRCRTPPLMDIIEQHEASPASTTAGAFVIRVSFEKFFFEEEEEEVASVQF